MFPKEGLTQAQPGRRIFLESSIHILIVFISRCPCTQVQHYILVVQAQDNGQPSLSTTLTVYFNVLDLNDNAPVFDPMSYSTDIYENVTIGTAVLTVSATDSDSGECSDTF